MAAPDTNEQLEPLRRRIDELDRQIVELLNQRAEVVVHVGHIKNAGGKPIYAPDREKAVLQKICQLNRGPLPEKTLKAIWRELMSGSFALEKPLRIAYLGPDGSFSHLASVGKFGSSVEYESVNDIRGVFEEVGRGHVDFGVVPIENSVGGGIIDTLDAFVETDVKVCAEINLAIHHNLMANCPIEDIRKVYSKPEVFTQCQRWLTRTDLMGKTIAVASSSKAAEMATQEPYTAAIGSHLAADLYSLKTICANIEDNPNNVTRFFVIGREWARPSGEDKSAIMFTTQHKAGALAEVLGVFKENGVNLTFITSRPSKRRNWEYYFFADAEGHVEDTGMKKALPAVKEHCLELHVLGSFPKAIEIE
jgi:chorismate mutase/prephenate dehydratase